MIHQPRWRCTGSGQRYPRSQPWEILKLKDELYQIISKHSGQTFKKVHEDSDRDYWMKAKEAKEYGMIDEVLVRN